MTIKVLTVETSAWNADDIKHAQILGEFAEESEALTEIWRDLVQKKHYQAYLLFRRHAWIKYWQTPVAIVWTGLHKGMPRMYQEPLDVAAQKKAAKLYEMSRRGAYSANATAKKPRGMGGNAWSPQARPGSVGLLSKLLILSNQTHFI